MKQTKLKYHMLPNGCLIESYVPLQLIENKTLIILYYSNVPIPHGKRIGLEFPRYKFN